MTSTRPSPAAGSRRPVRSIQRGVHLVASVLLLAYLYTPLGEDPVFSLMLRIMVVPVLTVSGIVMWQWPRVRRRLRAAAARRAGTPTAAAGTAAGTRVRP